VFRIFWRTGQGSYVTCIRQEADSIPGHKTLVLDSLRIQTETLSIIRALLQKYNKRLTTFAIRILKNWSCWGSQGVFYGNRTLITCVRKPAAGARSKTGTFTARSFTYFSTISFPRTSYLVLCLKSGTILSGFSPKSLNVYINYFTTDFFNVIIFREAQILMIIIMQSFVTSPPNFRSNFFPIIFCYRQPTLFPILWETKFHTHKRQVSL
jgi:hypothetical protein